MSASRISPLRGSGMCGPYAFSISDGSQRMECVVRALCAVPPLRVWLFVEAHPMRWLPSEDRRIDIQRYNREHSRPAQREFARPPTHRDFFITTHESRRILVILFSAWERLDPLA